MGVAVSAFEWDIIARLTRERDEAQQEVAALTERIHELEAPPVVPGVFGGGGAGEVAGHPQPTGGVLRASQGHGAPPAGGWQVTPLRLLSSVSFGARGKQPKAPKKYRKESEQERRARQAKRGVK